MWLKFFLAVSCIGTQVMAAEWKLIQTPMAGVRWYSSESYTLTDGTIRTYLKAEGRNLNVEPFAILIDCKNRRVRDYEAGQFGAEFYKPWSPIKPDSYGEIGFNAFCSNQKQPQYGGDKNSSSSKQKSDLTTATIEKSKETISDSYKFRVVARIKPNITYSGTTDISNSAVVEIRTSPDGTITSQKLVTSSGTNGWDDAVMKAIIKTEILPRDINGTVPSVILVTFSP